VKQVYSIEFLILVVPLALVIPYTNKQELASVPLEGLCLNTVSIAQKDLISGPERMLSFRPPGFQGTSLGPW
jgi:hypothetical protein